MKLQIEWQALELKPGNVTLKTSAVAGFQPATEFKSDDAISLDPRKGWLLILE